MTVFNKTAWIVGAILGTGLIGLGLGTGGFDRSAPIVGAAGAAAIAGLVWYFERRERRDWRDPTRTLTDRIRAAESGIEPFEPFQSGPDEFKELVQTLDRFFLSQTLGITVGSIQNSEDSFLTVWDASSATFPVIPAGRLTQSGLFEPDQPRPQRDPRDTPPIAPNPNDDALEMICRLEPRELRWLESSAVEQRFLGYSFDALQKKSFLDIVHPDDRELARAQLGAAIERGEAHGLIYRVQTARGETKAIEVNVGVRYAPETMAQHLRCHVTDVTAKLKADRDLRRRTKQLMKANQSLVESNGILIQVNSELKELKDRYSDLYQNAPVMYFTVDSRKILIDCNDTMLRALGQRERI